MNATTWSWLLAFLTLGGLFAYGFFFQEQPNLGKSVNDVSALQEAYFAKEGKYLQIKEGAVDKEGNPVGSKLGAPVDHKYRVHEYVSPDGAGYIIEWEDVQGFHSEKYGAETGSIFIPKAVATST